MGQEWIEDSRRPGGVGRSERERVFWERVASGRRPLAKNASDSFSARSQEPGRDAPPDCESNGAQESPREARWESLQLAIVTMLTVIVFGLGWVSLELGSETGADGATGYDWSLRDSGRDVTLVVQAGRARSD